MMSLARTILPRTNAIAPKLFVSSGANRFFGIGEDLAKKEKVEEDRFIRSKEHEDYLKRKAAEVPAAVDLSPEEETALKAHEEAVDEAFEILSKTGCKVADGTVEALAHWKLGK